MVASADTMPYRRARSDTAPEVLRVSHAAPCVTSIATDTRPHSNANGFNKPKNVPSYRMCMSSENRNGTPCSTLPIATPKISAGTVPLKNSTQSHRARHAGSSRLLRNLKATGRRMSARRITNIAR